MASGKLVILYPHVEADNGVYWIADYEFVVGFQKFCKSKMADPIWRSKNCFILYPYLKWDKGVFGVTDYEFAVRF